MTSVVTYTPIAGIHSEIVTAGVSVVVAGGDAVDGYIINPGTILDQGSSELSILYVDPTAPATTYQTATTVAIQPGARYDFPPNVGLGIWVNSATSGHKFTSVQILPSDLVKSLQAELDAKYVKGDFPPIRPTGVLEPINSYLYQEYSDDQDLQVFVNTYNSMMQDIVDTFNGLNLPNYVNNNIITGNLLDWVARGVYGMTRPSLTTGKYSTLGPYNTAMYNTEVYDWYQLLAPNIVSATTDDIFKRILTWHISKRDGKYFNIEWLKKRVMRFLMGINGTQPNIDNAYQVSVTFGPNHEVAIRLITGTRTLISGAIYDRHKFTYNNVYYNEADTFYSTMIPLPNILMFQEAISSGALELPFQFKYNVVIG